MPGGQMTHPLVGASFQVEVILTSAKTLDVGLDSTRDGRVADRQLRDPVGGSVGSRHPVIPLPRVSPENPTSGPAGRVRVVGVESEPLTAEQEAAAVRTLARRATP